MKDIIYTSCSELLVDTKITDPATAYDRFTKLFAELGWETSPPLSLNLLQRMHKANDNDPKDTVFTEPIPELVVYDRNGNRAWIEYGDNGYTTTGFRFDTHGNQCDEQAFPIFKEAIDRLDGSLEAYDGGSTQYYEDWTEGKTEGEDDE